jgi:peptide/nickel transport system substrate-binding protein
MNGRSGLFKFVVFVLLLVIVTTQILSIIQARRLYQRLDRIIEKLSSGQMVSRVSSGSGVTNKAADLPMPEYPGDEGDWLIWCFEAEPATLNPYVSKDLYARWVSEGNIFESLLIYDYDKVELKPFLAKSYEVSEDGLEVTFVLRDDIYFSDGVPVTADDVMFSYQTIINPKVDAHQLANYFEPIKEVIEIDKRTIRFIFDEPYFKGVEMAGGIPVMPKHIYEFTDAQQFNENRSNMVGSGPYLFERWDLGQQIVLKRNENYWGHKPKLKKVVFRIITNEVAALQALQAHEVDLLMPTSEQFVEMSKDEEFLKEFAALEYWNPGTGYSYIGWNQAVPFFASHDVRLAMTHLIDRQGIIDNILGGLGQIVTGPFYIFSPQYDSSIEPWPYNPDRAKELLDKAGWVDNDGDGIRDRDGVLFRFKFMIVSGSPAYERIARYLKDEMSKAGIEMTIDPYEWSVFEERLNQRKFDATTLAWGGVVQSDPYQIWHSSQIKGRGSNRIGFSNKEADALIEQARRTMDADKRNQMYHRFHRILHEEQPYTFIRSRASIRFIDKRFENVKVHKLGLDPLEWYVPKDKQRYQ